MKKTIRWCCAAVAVVCLAVCGGVAYWSYTLPDFYYVEQNDALAVNQTVTVHRTQSGEAQPAGASAGDSYRTTLRWLGIFPVKTVSVTVVNPTDVILGGKPFGVKLYTDGVLVVSLSGVDTATGTRWPARHAGLKVGDLIISVNGTRVFTNEQVSALVKESGGKVMTFRIKRDGVESELRFSAAKSRSEGCYKSGIWVRDSSAGIGTLTFYDPQTGLLTGLGHAVCDVDTGDIVPISSGEMVPARIFGVTKSTAGTPGELRGTFESGTYGTLAVNGIDGVYAYCDGIDGKTCSIALKQDIREGAAQVYTTVDGTEPQWYDVRITQVRYRENNATRNMVLKITDERLLNVTGGIVQGMSGSPIVQNGKLIGAVTHVLVDDPTRGYGIFAENMLETARSMNRLKEAG